MPGLTETGELIYSGAFVQSSVCKALDLTIEYGIEQDTINKKQELHKGTRLGRNGAVLPHDVVDKTISQIKE